MYLYRVGYSYIYVILARTKLKMVVLNAFLDGENNYTYLGK
jgi:hypothetical protein